MVDIGSTKVWPSLMIDLEQLDGGSVHFDKSDHHAIAGTVRFNDHIVAADRSLQIVDLEGDMRHPLYQLWNASIIRIALPLDTKWIVLMITYGDAQMREWNLALEMVGRWDADMLKFHRGPHR